VKHERIRVCRPTARRRVGGVLAVIAAAVMGLQAARTAAAANDPVAAAARRAAPAVPAGPEDPAIVVAIRKLIEADKIDAAVKQANGYVAGLPAKPAGAEAAARQYAALNGLCIALSRAGQLEQSEDICARAVSLLPNGPPEEGAKAASGARASLGPAASG
jgi:hypothetical protein